MKTAVIPALCGKEEDRGIALAQWQAQLRRFCLFVEHSDEFTLSEFVKKVDEIMPELRSAAMETVIHASIH